MSNCTMREDGSVMIRINDGTIPSDVIITSETAKQIAVFVGLRERNNWTKQMIETNRGESNGSSKPRDFNW